MELLVAPAFLFVFFPLVIGALGNRVRDGIIYSSICFGLLTLSYAFTATRWVFAPTPWFCLCLTLLLLGFATFSFTKLDSYHLNLLIPPPVIGLLSGLTAVLLFVRLLYPKGVIFPVIFQGLVAIYAVVTIILSCVFVSKLRSDKVHATTNVGSNAHPISPGTDFIVETVVEKPDKIPFACSRCGLSGNIPKAKLPPDKPKITIKCPKCGHPRTIDNPEYKKPD